MGERATGGNGGRVPRHASGNRPRVRKLLMVTGRARGSAREAAPLATKLAESLVATRAMARDVALAMAAESVRAAERATAGVIGGAHPSCCQRSLCTCRTVQWGGSSGGAAKQLLPFALAADVPFGLKIAASLLSLTYRTWEVRGSSSSSSSSSSGSSGGGGKSRSSNKTIG